MKILILLSTQVMHDQSLFQEDPTNYDKQVAKGNLETVFKEHIATLVINRVGSCSERLRLLLQASHN